MGKNLSILAFLILASFTLTGQRTLGLMLNNSNAYNGYTLWTSGMDAYLVDNCGYLINRWSTGFIPGLSCYILENGNLLRAGKINSSSFNGGGAGGRLEEYDWDGNLVWATNFTFDIEHAHHDFEPLPNGNILVILWARKENNVIVAAGRNPSWQPTRGLWTTKIIEIQKSGSASYDVVWEWDLFDHIIQDFDNTKPNYGIVADHPELLDLNLNGNQGLSDWAHINAIDYNQELDQIALSANHFSEVFIIDHSTSTAEAASHSGGRWGKGGDILYRFGNPQNYDSGTSSDRKFYAQHDARWVPKGYPNEGKLTVFNNGRGRPGGSYSTVDMWSTPMDEDGNYIMDGPAYGPDTLDWSYESVNRRDFFSSNVSGAHALPNGNMMICSGRQGNFFEVTPEKETVWFYKNPVASGGPLIQGASGNNTQAFRATKYLEDYIGFEGKDLTPGLPVELDPLPYECEIFENQTTIISNTQLVGIQVYPNPVKDILEIIAEPEGRDLHFEIFTIQGQIIKTGQLLLNQTSIDLNNFQNGIYFLKITDLDEDKFTIEKIIKQIN
jgi:hypothetical protein